MGGDSKHLFSGEGIDNIKQTGKYVLFSHFQ